MSDRPVEPARRARPLPIRRSFFFHHAVAPLVRLSTCVRQSAEGEVKMAELPSQNRSSQRAHSGESAQADRQPASSLLTGVRPVSQRPRA
jgi:hypothetical protein